MATQPSLEAVLLTSNFGVEIDSVLQGFFRECSGLQVQTDTFEYSEGGRNDNTHRLPVRSKVGNVTLKRGMVADDRLYTWYDEVINGTIKRRMVTIYQYGNKGIADPGAPKACWILHDALPVKYAAPTFKADESAVACDTIEFVCDRLERRLGG